MTSGKKEKDIKVPDKKKAKKNDEGKWKTITGVSVIFVGVAISLAILLDYPEYLSSFKDELLSSIGEGESENFKESEASKSVTEKNIVDTKDKVLPEQKSKSYAKQSITNAYDNKIRHLLDEADSLLEKENAQEALKKYESIMLKYSASPRGAHGIASCYDTLSNQQKSNDLLEKGIHQYMKAAEMIDVPFTLLKKTVDRTINRLQFRGWNSKGIKFLEKLIVKHPNEVDLYNKLGIQCLMTSNNEKARKSFKSALDISKDNPCALVHLGFIKKAVDNNPMEAIDLIQRGIDTRDPSTIDGRFYMQLGDSYMRTEQPEKAIAVYEQGTQLGLFLSKYQRSLYNVDHLKSRPWWTVEQTGSSHQLKMLTKNWKVIRDEALKNLDTTKQTFEDEAEFLRDTGDWKQMTFWQQGRKDVKMCNKAPKTCALFEKFTAATGCTRGQIKLSIMHPGTHVWPHTGPTNCRIRSHLGLIIPEGVKIRVADEIRTWEEGKFTIFDDSFEHEVWHNGTSLRLVLIVDVWHPDLTQHERKSLSPI